MGFFIFFVAGPFLLLAASFSIILLFKLIRELKSVRAKWRYLVGSVGVILATPSIIAILSMGINFVAFVVNVGWKIGTGRK